MKVNVWCAIIHIGITVSYFFPNESIKSEECMLMLQKYITDALPLNIKYYGHFQEDGTLPHYIPAG
jgi:hypothetical protein